jgi:hypothetical protein
VGVQIMHFEKTESPKSRNSFAHRFQNSFAIVFSGLAWFLKIFGVAAGDCRYFGTEYALNWH